MGVFEGDADSLPPLSWGSSPQGSVPMLGHAAAPPRDGAAAPALNVVQREGEKKTTTLLP